MADENDPATEQAQNHVDKATDRPSTALEIAPATEEMLDDMARICCEAFQAISHAHGFPTDFTTVDVARHVLGRLLKHSYVVAAVEDGRVVGSNAVQMHDRVAGIGPISVALDTQGRGIGRLLMQAVVNEARVRGHEEMRLHQDLFNMASLGLYATLGFVVREPVVVMQARPAEAGDPTVRDMVPEDIAACEALCRKNYGHSRTKELLGLLHGGMRPRVREMEGRMVAYQAGGFDGHGVGEAPEDILAIMGQIAREQPTPADKFLVPLRQHGLYQEALRKGARAVKAMSYMSLGPYRDPRGTWLPSISM